MGIISAKLSFSGQELVTNTLTSRHTTFRTSSPPIPSDPHPPRKAERTDDSMFRSSHGRQPGQGIDLLVGPKQPAHMTRILAAWPTSLQPELGRRKSLMNTAIPLPLQSLHCASTKRVLISAAGTRNHSWLKVRWILSRSSEIHRDYLSSFDLVALVEILVSEDGEQEIECTKSDFEFFTDSS